MDENFIYIMINGDDIGKRLVDAIQAGNESGLKTMSSMYRSAHLMIDKFIEEVGGKVIASAGDEGIYHYPASKIAEIEQIKEHYKSMTGTSLTMGIGRTLPEAAKALVHGKHGGKDAVSVYGDHMDSLPDYKGNDEDDFNHANYDIPMLTDEDTVNPIHRSSNIEKEPMADEKPQEQEPEVDENVKNSVYAQFGQPKDKGEEKVEFSDEIQTIVQLLKQNSANIAQDESIHKTVVFMLHTITQMAQKLGFKLSGQQGVADMDLSQQSTENAPPEAAQELQAEAEAEGAQGGGPKKQ